ncbi:hypothetical protein DICPUDRAFT_159697 [Dictyostelium purpureum]|uniref:Uncharacterized protein n=1 Tax=Dictyostelium purpureum TaxID=5786 RepID=F1A4R9_DICPU|nr:uncharacterized protein DICPUDRAFT_159697 [Dictyostelium purpureum]EGC28812.1 hypothetical protein DICPUDRAFT_159697 [Dictyostelium purpureum]|eukprot:XP_003294663.1 hypothetical protein DICPUDRAFT_159697 [Dictyostelium purpureum]
MFQSKSLSSFIGKAVSNSLKTNNIKFNTILNTTNSNKLFTTSSKQSSLYILNINNNKKNEISNSLKTILNNTNNNFNTNNHYRRYSTNSNNNNNNNNNNNTNNNNQSKDNGAHLIFENSRPYIHKLLFIVSGVQLCLCIFVLSEYYLESEDNRSKWILAGAVGLTLITFAFFHQMGKKDIASIHTFNKGRVVQVTSYGLNGFPTRKRTFTLDSIISSKSNDNIKSPIVNQDQSFFFKVPGDSTYYNANLKTSNIADPQQLERIIHASKQPSAPPKKKK